MTNYEHYKDEIDKIWGIGESISVTNKGVEKCIGTKCKDCLFSNKDTCCNITRNKWLVSEYKDPAEDVDWSKIPIDTPIFVTNNSGNGKQWFPRHFAKYEDGKIFAFRYGSDSWGDGNKNNITDWKYVKLASQENSKPQFQQKSTMSKEELMSKLCEQYEDSCVHMASKEMFEAVDNFWNSDIKDTKKQKISNMVMELLKMEEEENA